MLDLILLVLLVILIALGTQAGVEYTKATVAYIQSFLNTLENGRPKIKYGLYVLVIILSLINFSSFIFLILTKFFAIVISLIIIWIFMAIYLQSLSIDITFMNNRNKWTKTLKDLILIPLGFILVCIVIIIF